MYRMAIMTTNIPREFLVWLSDAGTECTTWSVTGTYNAIPCLRRDINDITSTENKWFRRELSICIIKFRGW